MLESSRWLLFRGGRNSKVLKEKDGFFIKKNLFGKFVILIS